MTESDGQGGQPDVPEQGSKQPAHAPSVFPSLGFGEWLVFAVLAGVIAATNIYTTLLIGWGDTGSIIAVLAAVLLLGLISKHKPSVHTLNLGQTMVSAGGSVGFAVASYAAVLIIRPDFHPPTHLLIPLFATMGLLGAIVGSTVRKRMVGYFFPSGTACAVIQKSVTEPVPKGRTSPVTLLTLWGGLAALLTVPTKIALALKGPEGEKVLDEDGATVFEDHAIWQDQNIGEWIHGVREQAAEFVHTAASAVGRMGERIFSREALYDMGVGVDPLYYGIGIVVGPRIGLGMLLGALAVPWLIIPGLSGSSTVPDNPGDWVKWLAIAVMTLPTFATIVFAYLFRTPPVIPPGFTPGVTAYTAPAKRSFVYGMVAVLSALGIGWLAWEIFQVPFYVSGITILIAWPLCVVNGRVTGDTDINPVRLVAIVLLSGFFWLITDQAGLAGDEAAIAMLGMAVVGGTLAACAVDMMQDYRTGYLVDADPVHQTSVQFVGTVVGAIVAIPVLNMLVASEGIGPGSGLTAPGAQVWATMAEAMAGGFDPSSTLLWAIGIVSVVGSVYAFLTVWPKTALWMPSLFGIGIGMLVGVETSMGIFLGGVLKWVVTLWYKRGKSGDAAADAQQHAGNDTMLAGASVFAAGAVLSILLIVVVQIMVAYDIDLFRIAGH
jgi:uncharacterized oligopeptide transporter (OPT) family protein